MRAYSSTFRAWVSVVLAGLAHAHIAPFHPAMYCVNGTTPGVVDYNNNAPVKPLYKLDYSEYWMHHENGCDEFPPDDGVFLELPAGQSFTVELADNRAHTTLNADAILSDWADGQEHPADYNEAECIRHPNLHTQNYSMAAGSSFAIAYKSNVHEVTLEDLVVFTVRHNSPWHRVTSYDVPSGMPPCPDDGCTCVWNWIPDHCGQPNMYMFPLRCKVIPDSTSPKTIGRPQAPVWCADDIRKCVAGSKQIMIMNQNEGNNIEVPGYDWSGLANSPAYNDKCGFSNGAQNDIFVDADALAVNASETGSGPSVLPASGPQATGVQPKRMKRQKRRGVS